MTHQTTGRGRVTGLEIDITALLRADDGETQPVSVTVYDPHLADLKAHNVVLDGTLTQLDDRLLLTATATAELELTCARCLEPFQLAANATLRDEFADQPTEEQFPLGRDRVDLAPAVRAGLLLNIPAQPIHDPACQGLCDVCGKNLNREPHQHDRPGPDNPFAELEKLR